MRKQMFIENRIKHKRNETDSCTKDFNLIKVFPQVGTTMKPKSNSSGGFNKKCKFLVFWLRVAQPKTIICEAQAIRKFTWREFKLYWTSEKERKVDALAPGADEGRDYLRKAAVSWK